MESQYRANIETATAMVAETEERAVGRLRQPRNRLRVVSVTAMLQQLRILTALTVPGPIGFGGNTANNA
jgi:hypothetical protein